MYSLINKWESLYGSVIWIKHRWWPATASATLGPITAVGLRLRDRKPIKLTHTPSTAIGRELQRPDWSPEVAGRGKRCASMSYKHVPLATAHIISYRHHYRRSHTLLLLPSVQSQTMSTELSWLLKHKYKSYKQRFQNQYCISETNVHIDCYGPI